MNQKNMIDEIELIKNRYERRELEDKNLLYNPFKPDFYMARQERDRALIRAIKYSGINPIEKACVLEIGCGAGSNVLQLIQWGFQPANIKANDLLDQNINVARRRLPKGVDLISGDASQLNFPDSTFDIVIQFTVFSSILDDKLQEKIAKKMWSVLKPGGSIIWYDFIYNNPTNQDVRGVPYSRVKKLFPGGYPKYWKVTLAPPISRKVSQINPVFYSLFNIFPFLRTHILCCIKKNF